ncbi:serine palmitoyltransferase small subunit B [Ascaphus truei]|uniref:serine palmitoyltransferase small subunit B n=1 Tax=Ascaphus truei TaxID=8439 RepID=UPI003F59CFCF
MDIKHIKDYLYWLYYQYLLITCCYILEPWEQSILNTVLLTVVTMVIYSSYVFIQIHVQLAMQFFSGTFGGQHESTVAIMN